MSDQKLKEIRDPATQCCWPDCANAPLLTCGSCGICRYCSKACQVRHWKSGHKIACKRKGRVDFALFNIPHITKRLLPLDNEPNHGGVAERIRLWMAGKNNKDGDTAKYHQLNAVDILDGGSVLFEYYINREMLSRTYTIRYREGSVEGYAICYRGGGLDIGVGCIEKLVSLVGSREFDPYREKVAEEILLCEFMLQDRICNSHILKQSAYQGAAKQDFEKYIALGRQLSKDFFDIQAHVFKQTCNFRRQNGMVDEAIALCEEMYNRICEENGPADPVLQGVVSDMAWYLAESGKDLDRAEQWASRAADNLRSYVRDSDPVGYWGAGGYLATCPMAVIIKKTKSEERKAAVYQEAEELLSDIISKSEEHFGADSFEVGYALTNILMVRQAFCPLEPATSSIELAMRACDIYSRMKRDQIGSYLYYVAFTHTAKAIVLYYSDVAFGKIIITQDEKKKLVQAANFLVKEARESQQKVNREARDKGSDLILDSTADNLNQLMRMRA
jgi:hypothetical protein